MMYKGLEDFVPSEDAVTWVLRWLEKKPLPLRVTRNRKTKLGDFRHNGGNNCRISINGDLDKDLFFFVLTHEIAHYHVFLDHFPKRILPHGVEWQRKFGQLLQESIAVYPKDLQPIILNHAQKPKANFYTDVQLSAYFSKEEQTLLHQLPEGSRFLVKNKWFRKGEKRRIKYICTELQSGRRYVFHPQTPIDSSK